MGVTGPIVFIPLFSHFFSFIKKNCLPIEFHILLFDGCPYSWAVVTPVKYEWDQDNLAGAFTKLDISLKRT